MPNEILLFLCVGIVIVAFLYSSVGHAGASGYIAVMSLLNLVPTVIKPTALMLNILVASIATWQFWRAGHFSWRLFWPFALLAIPLSFLGGYINLPTRSFKILAGAILIFSAVRFLLKPSDDTVQREASRLGSVAIGGGFGLLAGLTGTGGGIFLTPFLLLMRWATAKQAASVSALFILLNSVAGLLGNVISTKNVPSFAVPLGLAAIAGGSLGSYLGSYRLAHRSIKRLLAAVLLIAGGKLIFTD